MDLTVEQLTVTLDPAGPAVRGRSSGIAADFEAAAVELISRAGVGPDAGPVLFAYPLGRRHVAVGRSAGRRISLLVLPRRLYAHLGDPFAVSAAFPPDFAARDDLPSLAWPPRPLPGRTAAGVMTVLRTGDMPLLLGGAQALVDGSRLVLTGGPAGTAEALWQLLPDRTRCELWPATGVMNPGLAFDVTETAAAPDPVPPGTLTADQCRDYPEGRYELALQTAAESGDDAALSALFARRTSRDTLRLAAGLVLAALAVAAAAKVAG